MTDLLPHEVWHLRSAQEAIVVREIPAPVVVPREALADEIPNGAKQVINKMTKAGWLVRVEYGKHSWPKQSEKVEDASGNVVEKVPFGIVESIVVKGKRGKQRADGSTVVQRLFAIWMTKPWTKDGDTFKFYTSHFIPDAGKVSSPELKRLIESSEGGETDDSEEGAESSSDLGHRGE